MQTGRDWAYFAHRKSHSRNVDAADGVFDGPAAPLPERRLTQLLADAHRLVGALADQVRPQQRDGRGDKALARHGTADAGQAFVGDDLNDRIEILFWFHAAGPTAVNSPSR